MVGLLYIVIWKVKKDVKIKYFLMGGLIWLASMIPKIIMDFTVTSTLSSWVGTTFGLVGFFVIMGVYFGIRTGLLECSFPYLVFSRGKLRKMSPNEVMAFGIGFGAFEAILLAIPSILQIAAFIVNPSIIEMLPPASRQLVEVQLNMPTWIVPAPIIERAFVVLAHLFATLLIFASVKRGELKFFFGALAYKSVLDGAIPYVQSTFNPYVSPFNVYVAEIWVAFMGLIALVGIFRVKNLLK